jgi:hypothetical protein
MKEALTILEARGIEMMSQETTDAFFTVRNQHEFNSILLINMTGPSEPS